MLNEPNFISGEKDGKPLRSMSMPVFILYRKREASVSNWT